MVGFVGNGPHLTTAGESGVYTLAQTVEGFYPPTIPDLDNYVYEGATQSLDCSPPELSPEDLYITPDGLNIFFTGRSGDVVAKAPLSTAYDLTSAGTITNFSVNSQEGSPTSLHFADNPNDISTYGKKCYVTGTAVDTVFEYNLTTAWDLSTASFTTGDSYNLTSDGFQNPQSLRFSRDGSKMFVLGPEAINQYQLSTPWQVNTASSSSGVRTSRFSSATYDGLAFSYDGKTGYLVSTTGDVMQQFHMGSAFNLIDVTNITEVTLDTSGNKAGVFISTDNTKFFIIEDATDLVTRYSFG